MSLPFLRHWTHHRHWPSGYIYPSAVTTAWYCKYVVSKTSGIVIVRNLQLPRLSNNVCVETRLSSRTETSMATSRTGAVWPTCQSSM